MGDLQSLARKLHRALRNETGVKLTLEEMLVLQDFGTVDLITQARP